MNTKERREELFNKGIENFRKENTYEAILSFKEILKENPEDAEANYYLANCYTLMDGAVEFAIPYFEKAIEIDGDKYEYYLDMAAALKYLGKFERSLSILEEAKEKFKGLGNAYIMIASIYLSMGKEKKARNYSRIGNEYPRYKFDSYNKEWILAEPAAEEITIVKEEISVKNKAPNESRHSEMTLPAGIEYLEINESGEINNCTMKAEFKSVTRNKKIKKYVIEFDEEKCAQCEMAAKCISSKRDSKGRVSVREAIIKNLTKSLS